MSTTAVTDVKQQGLDKILLTQPQVDNFTVRAEDSLVKAIVTGNLPFTFTSGGLWSDRDGGPQVTNVFSLLRKLQ